MASKAHKVEAVAAAVSKAETVAAGTTGLKGAINSVSNRFVEFLADESGAIDIGTIVGKGRSKTVDIELKYKDGWSAAQKAEADAKVKALSEANTVKTQSVRSGTSASSRYKSAYGETSVQNGYDVDHTIDLQLGGADKILNMNPLDMSVNRSLGVQIKNAIKDYDFGTVFDKFTIK